MHYNGPSAGAHAAESPYFVLQKNRKNICHEIDVGLTDVHSILHARSCIHFISFPHTPKQPRPLKRPQNFNLLFEFSGPIWAMLTRPVRGPHYHLGRSASSEFALCASSVTKLLGHREATDAGPLQGSSRGLGPESVYKIAARPGAGAKTTH